jgi:hypothetical protein
MTALTLLQSLCQTAHNQACSTGPNFSSFSLNKSISQDWYLVVSLLSSPHALTLPLYASFASMELFQDMCMAVHTATLLPATAFAQTRRTADCTAQISARCPGYIYAHPPLGAVSIPKASATSNEHISNRNKPIQHACCCTVEKNI